MARLKLPSGRPELSIEEVFDLIEWTAEDLFYLASKSLLTIHVMADNWNVDHIDEINNSNEFTKQPSTNQQITVGNHTIYREFSPFALSGLQPISVRSIMNYRNGSASAKIAVDIHKVLKSSDDTKEYLFYPSPDILIQDALNDGKLFVMKADILKMASNNSTSKQDEVPNKKGSRTQTLERYADWQKRADDKIKKNPALSTYAVAELIHADLEREKSKLIRSVDAIRQHIKI